MIMRKFEELERIMAANAQQQPATQPARSDPPGATSSGQHQQHQHAQPPSHLQHHQQPDSQQESAQEPAAHPLLLHQQQQQQQQQPLPQMQHQQHQQHQPASPRLDEQCLLEVFKATSMFDVRAAMVDDLEADTGGCGVTPALHHRWQQLGGCGCASAGEARARALGIAMACMAVWQAPHTPDIFIDETRTPGPLTALLQATVTGSWISWQATAGTATRSQGRPAALVRHQARGGGVQR
jgi:hypothetical protein